MTWPGSKGPAGFPKFSIDNPRIDSRVCFVPMITDDSRALLRFYRAYDKGLLLDSGGILDQPEKYLTGMAIIEQRVNEHYADRGKN